MSLGGAQQGSASHGDANGVGAAKLLTPSPVTQANSHAKRIEAPPLLWGHFALSACDIHVTQRLK